MDKQEALLLVLGNQLFPRKYLRDLAGADVFMAEDLRFCTDVRHHQQKLTLVLAAMRAYADELRDWGFTVHYHALDQADGQSYEERLGRALASSRARRLLHFEIEDKPIERRIVACVEEHGLEREELRSPMFLCSRERFAEFRADSERLRMADFYREERLRLAILVDGDGQPAGGRWSFDADNRKKLPRDLQPPDIPSPRNSAHVAEVTRLVQAYFPDHPGNAADFWWPSTRAGAKQWLDDFLVRRLARFGPFEDAISTRSATVFHSLLSPLMNIGLLTPREIVDGALEFARQNGVPLQSIEGFVRQIVGWREFIRGVYRECSEEQENANFFSHDRELTEHWYDGTTGLPPLDDAIKTALQLGWTHHIQRLMVVANVMTLCEIRPSIAHRWFMEMFVDSADWVMGPNVYGMGLFSDGGLFATKPYICGSNYLRKMSDYKKGPWCDVLDGLYWRFIDKHRDFFGSKPRLALMPKALDRLDAQRRRRIFAAAAEFIERVTRPGAAETN